MKIGVNKHMASREDWGYAPRNLWMLDSFKLFIVHSGVSAPVPAKMHHQ